MESLAVSRNSSSKVADAVLPYNIVNGTYPELIAYLVLNMWPSHFGLPILLLTILLSKKIQRHPTFVNMLIVWIIAGVSSSLLVYAGKTTGPEPSKMLCLFQASLIYGMPPMTSMSVFMLVLQMFLLIRATFHGQGVIDEVHTGRLWVLLTAPYLALLATAVTTAAVGAVSPNMISRDRRFFYCSVESNPLTNTLTTIAAGILLGTVILEVWTAVILYKRWRALRRQGGSLRASVELGLPIRIIAFGVYIVIALSLGLLSIKAPQSPVPDLIIASAASVVLLIFGTQPDILRAFCFWRTEHEKASPMLSKNEYIRERLSNSRQSLTSVL